MTISFNDNLHEGWDAASLDSFNWVNDAITTLDEIEFLSTATLYPNSDYTYCGRVPNKKHLHYKRY